jgi:histidyl-tRNA synthetase
MDDESESLRCPGMRDLLPDEMSLYRRTEEAFARLCDAWGYSEIRTPTIEFLHLFTAAGTLSPQMLGRVYSFLDWDGWSGERVVLRPDATIPTVRLYVENVARGRPARYFYLQNVFRFSRGDESREDWQCGVELIGNPGPVGDIELVLLGKAALESFGLRDIEVGLSHAGLVRAVLARTGLEPQEQAARYDCLLDGDLTVIPEIEARLPDLRSSLHLLFEAESGGSEYLADLREAFAAAVPGIIRALDDLTTICGTLDRLDCRYSIQTTLVRNFEYYTGTVFDFHAAGSRMGSGGRYDGLIGLVGSGGSVPASGFALSLSEVVSHLQVTPEAAPRSPQLFIETRGAAADVLAESFLAAERLRGQGKRIAVAVPGMPALPEDRLLSVEPRGNAFVYRLRKVAGQEMRDFPSLDALVKAIETGEA